MSARPEKRILIAPYYFPPFNGVSWIRATKFAKYLPEYGWQVQVLSVDPKHYPEQRLGPLPEELDGMRIDRLRLWPVPCASFLAKLLYPLAITLAAVRQRNSLDAVMLCGSPFHPLLVAGLIRGLAGLRVYADFRDSWSSDTWGRHKRNFLQPAGDLLRRWLERSGLVFCEAATFATERLCRDYRRRHPSLANRFHAVTNGVDLEDIRRVRPVPTTEPGLSLLMAGKFLFYTPQLLEPLLRAMQASPGMRFVYVGEEAQAVAGIATELGLRERVGVQPQLPYAQALAQMAAADIGLVTTSNPEGLGTKLFEYLALGKPVICCVPYDSEIVDRFADCPGVVICTPPFDTASLARALDAASGLIGSGIELPPGYSRRDGARVLAEILDGNSSLAGNGP